MCTVSWCRPTKQGYSLFFNRDERKDRLPAIPPQARECGGTTFLSPTDANCGGTWLLANAHGVTAGLLNHYSAAATFEPVRPISRGQLVLSLAAATDSRSVGAKLADLDLACYRPFLVFAIDPSEAWLWIWDGQRLAEQSPQLPLTTSSHKTEAVTTARREAFAALGEDPSPEQLSGFHRSHDPDRPAFSVRMRRPNSRTVSHSRIDVTRDAVSFAYRPEPDDSLTLADEVQVTIRRN